MTKPIDWQELANELSDELVSMDKWLEHAKEYSYKMQAIEPPYDEYENELISKISAIQREAYDRAEPFRNALVQSRIRKTAKYILTTEKKP